VVTDARESVTDLGEPTIEFKVSFGGRYYRSGSVARNEGWEDMHALEAGEYGSYIIDFYREHSAAPGREEVLRLWKQHPNPNSSTIRFYTSALKELVRVS